MFNVENEGYNTIDYTGFDNVENTSLETFGVKVDNTGPEISLMFGTSPTGMREGLEAYPSHTVLFVSATDKIVGYQRMTYSINGTPAKEYLGIIKNLHKGKISMKFIASDQLGNATEKEIQFYIE